MNKLGFVIKLASQGTSTHAECNIETWRDCVVDTREYLKFFSLRPDDVFTFLTFDKQGCCIVQQKPIAGRGGDYKSAWLYVPNTIAISTEELMDAYQFARQMLLSLNVHDMEPMARQRFARTYPELPQPQTYMPSSGQHFGFRLLSIYNLRELIDRGLYQPAYSSFRAIFLLEPQMGAAVTQLGASVFTDFTNVKPQRLCTIALRSQYPLQADVAVAYLDQQNKLMPLRRDTTFAEGTELQLYATRNGFDSMPLTPIVVEPGCTIDIPGIAWTKTVTPSSFLITDTDQQPIGSYEIVVNGQLLDGRGIQLTEQELTQVEVSVSARGYQPSQPMLVSLAGGPVSIQLQSTEPSISSDIMLKNKQRAKLTLTSMSLARTQNVSNLLAGYSYDPSRRMLVPTGGGKWTQRFIGMGIMLLIVSVLAIGWGAASALFDDEPKTATTTGETKNEQTKQQADKRTEEERIVAYLNNNNKWSQDSLTQYAAVRELYDDLNRFNLETFSDQYASLIDKCDRMKQIAEAIDRWNEAGKAPREFANGTWNKEGDAAEISVGKYVSWLNSKLNPPKEESPDKNRSAQKKDTPKNTDGQGKKTTDLKPRQDLDNGGGNNRGKI